MCNTRGDLDLDLDSDCKCFLFLEWLLDLVMDEGDLFFTCIFDLDFDLDLDLSFYFNSFLTISGVFS